MTGHNAMQCTFCQANLSKAPTPIGFPDMNGDFIDFNVCPGCYSFNPNFKTKSESNVEQQARFHEDLFGVEDKFAQSYIDDARGIKRIITHDYSEYFGDKDSDLICELGSGRGHLLKALIDEGFQAIGCEFSSKLVSAGKKIYELPDDVFVNTDAWSFPDYLKKKSLTPSVIILWHVIEHIEGSIRLLKEMVEVCAKDITIIFQTPLPTSEYIFPEHLFFPSSETYHHIANTLGLEVKLLNVIPYNRYMTCILSNKPVSKLEVIARQNINPGWTAYGQLLDQLNTGLKQLDRVTKEQYQNILSLKKAVQKPTIQNTQSILLQKISNLAETIQNALNQRDSKNDYLKDQISLMRKEFLRAEAQINLLKDISIIDKDEYL